MKQFRLIDNLLGWITFAIAAWVYCSTIEPTASFWDCPEFITTGYKLEVGHPPGAPFFMLTANLFSQLVSDPSEVARMVNMMSALFSAACIMFLFWSISHLTRKLICDKGWVKTMPQLITIEASALVGALAYTFSDTFWFSAVEGEVYAYSSLFTAIVFWLMLKWEDNADKPHSDRWLILIAYLTGLSIGVHLLNLLCLPALVLIYYYRRYENANVKGSLIALVGSFVIVGAVLYGIVPGIVKVGGWFELLFVNGMGLGFNTGLIIYIFSLISVVLWAIWETTRQRSRLLMGLSYCASIGMLGIPFYGHGLSSILIGVVVLAALFFVIAMLKRDDKPFVGARLLNTSLLCMLMIMVGYSSYAVIVIRSTANTPMDQNSPEDIFTLGTYLNREQYGDRPLFYGQVYSSPVKYKPTEDGKYLTAESREKGPVYIRQEKKSQDEKDQYQLLRHNLEYVYEYNMLFPRMYSDRHAKAYDDWLGGIQGKQVTITSPYTDAQTIKVPTFAENIRFFLSYQMNFMYFRYLMWNFCGRQNDIQGNGEIEHGNWITGISFIDNARLGDQSKLPTELKENKGRNVFYGLPLLLALIGMFWQIGKSDQSVKQFWVVFFLFFMTGIAIVIYLNQTPQQPRERDYAYAGSFYAFAIWIGLGVAALADLLKRYVFKKGELVPAVLSCICVLIPVQMASQTWDDHDRSGRYTCRDFGQNYLQSMQQEGNPIIYTNGDNDTFPLWYNQETEGFRTDTRVCNLSYLQTDWYIDQMRRPAYDSPAVPISWSRLQYVEGVREATPVQPGLLEQAIEYYKGNPEQMREILGDNPYELRNIIDKWVLSDNKDLQCIPTDSIVMTIDKEAVRRSGMLIPGDSIPDVMTISLKGKRSVYKSEMMMYEMLASCNWERPLYMSVTVGEDSYGDLGKNFMQEGLAYRITPFNTQQLGVRIDSKRMYDNLMNRFKFGGLDQKGLYLDETVMRMCYTHRRMFAQLAGQLAREGDTERLKKVLARAEEALPSYNVPHDYRCGSLELAELWAHVGDKARCEQIASEVAQTACEYLTWQLQLGARYDSKEFQYHGYVLKDAITLLEECGSKKADEFKKKIAM